MNVRKGKFRIRSATAQDAKQLYKWWNDGKVMAHAGFPNGLGIAEGEIVASLENDNRFRRRLIIEYDNEPLSGQGNLDTKRGEVKRIFSFEKVV